MIRVGAIALLGLLLLVGCGDDEEEPVVTGGEVSTASTVSTTTAEAAPAAESAEEAEDPGTEEIEIGRPVTIRNTLEAVLTGSTDAALICDVLATEKYVRTAYGAREGCIAAQRPGALADSVRVESIRSGPAPGVAATALVIPAGGPYDGVEVEVELVRDGGGWQVDSLLADVPAGP